MLRTSKSFLLVMLQFPEPCDLSSTPAILITRICSEQQTRLEPLNLDGRYKLATVSVQITTLSSANQPEISITGKTNRQLEAHSRSSSKTEEALKLWKIEESSTDFTLFDFDELATATDNFSEDNKLGRGGFGPAWQLWREGRGFELIDPTLGDGNEVVAMMRCVKVALLCVQDNAMDRPVMADVAAMLASDGVRQPDPAPPPHFQLRVTAATCDDERTLGGEREARSRWRFTDTAESCSTNDVTITTIEEGR
ncbi:hypothetical protein ABZP36_002050 [Zizania latifolia]